MIGYEESLIEQYRNSRDKWVVVWQSFVNEFSKYYSNSVFCFYEGEDSKYYDHRIKAKTTKNIMRYPTGSKENVLKVRNKIIGTELYQGSSTLFFVDRDFDNDKTEGNLYVTPSYSIENLYATESSFKQIIETELYLNCSNVFHGTYMLLFNQRFDEFLNLICEFNSVIAVNRRSKGKDTLVSVNDIKTNKLFKISIESIEKTDKYDSIILKLLNEMNLNNSDIQMTFEEFKNDGMKFFLFRGKNVLDFFVSFTQLIIAKHNKEANNINGMKKSTLNISKNRLSELSQYALTPKCLDDFLARNL